MGNSLIIKKFLGAGYQLSQEALEFFKQNSEKIDEYLSVMNNLEPKPTIITLETIQKSLPLKPITQTKQTMVVESVFDGGRKPRNIQEVVSHLTDRYQKISRMLQERPELSNLLSIRKITDKTTKFSIIGLIRDKDKDSLVVEDPTGETDVYLEEEQTSQLVYDEVVGLVCENERGRITVTSVVRPDIPLKKEVARAKSPLSCYIISDLEMSSDIFDEKRYKKLIETIKKDQTETVVFMLGGIANKKKDLERFVSDLPEDSQKIYLHQLNEEHLHREDVQEFVRPLIINIDGVRLLLAVRENFKNYLSGSEKTPAAAFLDLVKKRHLSPTFNYRKQIYDRDPYLLETVPDLFCLGQCQLPEVINHKGVTIVTPGNLSDRPVFWKINLKTRESIKIDLT